MVLRYHPLCFYTRKYSPNQNFTLGIETDTGSERNACRRMSVKPGPALPRGNARNITNPSNTLSVTIGTDEAPLKTPLPQSLPAPATPKETVLNFCRNNSRW